MYINMNSTMWSNDVICRIFHYKKVTSTNDVAKQHVRCGETIPFFVIADAQTNGRGRRGNVWNSDNNGNLYATYVCLVGYEKIANIAILSQCVAIKICDVMFQQLNINTNVKWPNDIFINNKKVGGILLETIIRDNKNIVCMIGVGMNICQSPHLQNARYETTCISEFSDASSSLNDVNHIILQSIASGYDMFLNIPLVDIIDQWSKYDMHYNRIIKVECANGIFLGRSIGIDDTGALQLERQNGEIIVVRESDAQIKIM